MDEVIQLQRPLISIVVPMYNAEEFIDRTLASALGQSYPTIEVIVVDDFSEDGSAEIVIQVSKVDDRVRYLRNDKKGANSARLKGVSCARGEYIMFLDSDDELLHGAAGRLLEIIQSNEADLVCANILYAEDDSEVLRFSYPSAGAAIDLREVPEAILEVKPSACAKLFATRLFQGMDFINVPFAQDWNISYKSIANAKKVFFSDEAVYRYRIREGSTSTRKSTLELGELLSVLPCLTDLLSYRGPKGGRIWPNEAAVIASNFMLNMVGRSFRLPVDERRVAHAHLKAAYFNAVDWSTLVRVPRRERARVAALVFMFTCWPAYEVFRVAWGDSGRLKL